MLKLVKFSKKYKNQLFEMMDEWTAVEDKIIPWSIRRADYHNLDEYIPSLSISKPQNGFVPDSTYFLLDTDQNKFLGAVNIRHYLNDFLLFASGHIGDGIRPSERGKGYATKMIALALQECKKLGIDRVLMCCKKSNVASARTIIKNGGKLENEVVDGDHVVQRYWIEI